MSGENTNNNSGPNPDVAKWQNLGNDKIREPNWIKTRLERNKEYDEKRQKVAERYEENRETVNQKYEDNRSSIIEGREKSAEDLAKDLPDIAKSLVGAEIVETYKLNRDLSSATPIKERRSGVKDYYKEAKGIDNKEINFALYPHEAEKSEGEKSFMEKELENIAKATGRTTDDEDVRKLNLVLRYQTFNNCQKLYDTAKASGVMIQQGTLEDLATAKRELEEAMYLYDPSFKAADDNIEELDKKHRSATRALSKEKRETTKKLDQEQYDKNHDAKAIYKEKKARERYERNYPSHQIKPDSPDTAPAPAPAPDQPTDQNAAPDSSTVPDQTVDSNATPDQAPDQPADPNVAPANIDGNNIDVDIAQAMADANAAATAADIAQAKADADAATDTVDIDQATTDADEDIEQPLVAINADFTHDRAELAHDLAERGLNADLATAGFIKRLWKGTLFKRYYQQKTERDFLENGRTTDVDGESLTVDQLITRRSKSAIERFVLGAVEDARYIHESAGESKAEADQKTTAAVRKAIEKYASADIPENGNLKNLDTMFENEIGQIMAEARDDGKDAKSLKIGNYLEVAKAARARVEHGIAMEKVMEGFKVYNAEVRDGIRTQAHRDNIDKIINKIENSKIGKYFPSAEVIAGGVTIAAAITKKVGTMVGGIAVSGAISGLRERNRVTEDRARMLRDAANGIDYEGTQLKEEDIAKLEGREKRKAKYEYELGGTNYKIEKASELVRSIEHALTLTGPSGANILRSVIANAKMRIKISDESSKDLIAYSSEDTRGDERLKLDVAVIRAEKALAEPSLKQLEDTEKVIEKEIWEDIDKKDKDFRKLRRARSIKKAGKTVAIGAVMAGATRLISQIVSGSGEQEIESLAEEQNVGTKEFKYEKIISEDDPVQMKAYEDAGYSGSKISDGFTTTSREVVDLRPEEVVDAGKIKIDGWADNGTKGADFNELGLHMRNGQMVSELSGTSTMGSQSFNYEELANAGQIKGIININGVDMEVMPNINEAGQLTWGEGGVFTTPSGETIRGITENGEEVFKYFRVAVDNGVDEDGVKHVISLATEVGQNDADVAINKITENVVEYPGKYLYTMTQTVPEQVAGTVAAENIAEAAATGGSMFAFAPETARTGIGGISQNAAPAAAPTTEATPAAEATPATEAAPAPAPAPAAETTPAPAAETTTAPEANPNGFNSEEFANNYRNVTNRLRRDIGDNGVEYLTDVGGYTPEKSEAYNSWWDTLGDNSRSNILGLMRNLDLMDQRSDDEIRFGRALRYWLRMNNLI